MLKLQHSFDTEVQKLHKQSSYSRYPLVTYMGCVSHVARSGFFLSCSTPRQCPVLHEPGRQVRPRSFGISCVAPHPCLLAGEEPLLITKSRHVTSVARPHESARHALASRLLIAERFVRAEGRYRACSWGLSGSVIRVWSLGLGWVLCFAGGREDGRECAGFLALTLLLKVSEAPASQLELLLTNYSI